MENEIDLKLKTNDESQTEKEPASCRNFLHGSGKWSLAVIGGVALGNVAAPLEAKGRFFKFRRAKRFGGY
jgi:hypothetical protein